jgi:hypothetical protein
MTAVFLVYPSTIAEAVLKFNLLLSFPVGTLFTLPAGTTN